MSALRRADGFIPRTASAGRGVASLVLAGALAFMMFVVISATHIGSGSSNELADLKQADEFWAPFVFLGPPEGLDFRFGSVDDLTHTVDLVVRGRISDVYVGERWTFIEGFPAEPLAYASVAVEEVLKGDPVSRTPGFIEVQLAPISDSFDLRSNPLPTEEYIWFLVYEPDWRAAIGRKPVDSDIAPFAYFRPNHHQAVIRSDGGFVSAPLIENIEGAYGSAGFPVDREAQLFASLVAEIRAKAVL